MHSTLTNKTMAIARLSLDAAVEGTKLHISGKNVDTGATAHPITFDDPKKSKRTAVG